MVAVDFSPRIGSILAMRRGATLERHRAVSSFNRRSATPGRLFDGGPWAQAHGYLRCLAPRDREKMSKLQWRLESRQNPHAGKIGLRDAAFPGCGLAELSSSATGARLRRTLVVSFKMRPFSSQFSLFSVRFGRWRLLFYGTTRIAIRIRIKNSEMPQVGRS